LIGRRVKLSIDGHPGTSLKKRQFFSIRIFQSYFPEFILKVNSWRGTFGKTMDSLPLIREYKKTPNTYYALDFGGNGITFSVIAAQSILDLIMGNKRENAEIFAFQRKSI
jgi:glycine/D-amino acid oxidase-like deaminating enzyme